MGLNCFSSAGYVLYMRKRIKHFNFKDFDTVYYNNILSLPVMLVLSLCLEGWTSGEFERTLYVQHPRLRTNVLDQGCIAMPPITLTTQLSDVL